MNADNSGSFPPSIA